VNEEVNQDKNGEAKEMSLKVDYGRCDAHPNERSVIRRLVGKKG